MPVACLTAIIVVERSADWKGVRLASFSLSSWADARASRQVNSADANAIMLPVGRLASAASVLLATEMRYCARDRPAVRLALTFAISAKDGGRFRMTLKVRSMNSSTFAPPKTVDGIQEPKRIFTTGIDLRSNCRSSPVS
jgi:hypothetical protein